MARRRFRRKDLKRPDEFVTLGSDFLEWLQEHVRLVAYVGGTAALVGVEVVVFFSVRGARVRQANDDLSHALAAFQSGHYADAANRLGDVARRWESTDAGRIARLYAADADLKADNLASATVLLEEALRSHDWPSYLRQQALFDLGYALERKKDPRGAAERYGQAAAIEGPYTSMALLGEARSWEQAGQKDKARALYERYSREYPQAPDAEVAAAKAADLKG